MDTERLGFGDLSALGPPEEWPTSRLFMAASRLTGPVLWRIVERHARGVSPAGFFLLRALVAQNGLRAGEVARRLMISPATVTSVADTLERNGHVERRRDPRDRRVVLLHITDAGRQLMTGTGQSMAGELDDIYGLVDEADEPAVRRFLLATIERLDGYLKGERP